MPKVSIIIPVYNVEKYLEKCLNSVVNQTLTDIEIIVVNDGSLDNSQAIINKFINMYPDKIKNIIKENGGQGSARNEGLKIATGEYIGYVDSDDFVDITMYEKMYNNAKKHNSDIVIAGNYIISETGNIIKSEIFKCNKKSTSIKETKAILFDKTGVWNKIYKTEFLKKLNIKFRSKKWYEDFDFTIAVLLQSSNISIMEEALYYYLLRDGSTMNNSNVERNLEILEAMDQIIKYCKEKNLYNLYYDEMEFLAIHHVYISTLVRIINASYDNKLKKHYMKKIIKYMNTEFKNFKNNNYIKTNLPKKRKCIFILLDLKLYFVIELMFKLRDIFRKVKK